MRRHDPWDKRSGMEHLSEMARELNRPVAALKKMLKDLGLPVPRRERYPTEYVVFLRKVMALRRLGVGEERLARLFQLEKDLMRLLRADVAGSEIWFLDFVMQVGGGARRLLLTNFDVGCDLEARALQPGLDLAGRHEELFEGEAMGEDALRVLKKYLAERATVLSTIEAEMPLLRGAVLWGRKVLGRHPGPKGKARAGRKRRRMARGGSGEALPGLA